jgi:hypothetical protein
MDSKMEKKDSKHMEAMKYDWSKCVGMKYDDAEKIIKEQKEDADIKKLHKMPLTREFFKDRVRVIVDEEDVVLQEPRLG